MKEIRSKVITDPETRYAPVKPTVVEPTPSVHPDFESLGQEEKKPIIVAKLGGFAMSTRQNVEKSAEIVDASPKRRIVVVAAPGERDGEREEDKAVTQLLYEAWGMREKGEHFDRPIRAIQERFHEHDSLLRESSFIDDSITDLFRGMDNDKTSKEWIVSRGEELMMHVFARIVGGAAADPKDFLILNNGKYSFVGGLPREESVPDIVAGHYGSNGRGDIELFPSPGGNYTASIIAAEVNAEALEIYKEEPGFLSADPSVVSNPHSIQEITYKEMISMNYGSETPIVPGNSVLAAIESNTPIHVRSLHRPDEGTTIVPRTQGRSSGDMVVGVVGKGGSTSFTVTGRVGIHHREGIAAEITKVFAEEGRSIDQIVTEINNVTVVVGGDQLTEGNRRTDPEVVKQQLLDKLGGKVKVRAKENLGTVCVVGEEIGERSAKVIGKVATALDEAGIDIAELTHAGGKNVLFTVEETQLSDAINAVHDVFFRPDDSKNVDSV